VIGLQSEMTVCAVGDSSDSGELLEPGDKAGLGRVDRPFVVDPAALHRRDELAGTGGV
jgi:hypothetical protein